MSRYSHKKNPHSDKCLQVECEGCNGWSIEPCEVLAADYYEEGFLAAEKEYALTEKEKAVFRDMLADHDPDLEKWGGDMVEALGSIEKKVLGE